MAVYIPRWAATLPVGRTGHHISLLIVLVFGIFSSQGVDQVDRDAVSQSAASAVDPLLPLQEFDSEVHRRAERNANTETSYSPYTPSGPSSQAYQNDQDYGEYNWDYLVPDYAKYWWPKYPSSQKSYSAPQPIQSSGHGTTGRSDTEGLEDAEEEDNFFADAPEVFEDDGTSLDGLNDVASDGFIPHRRRMIMDPAFPARGGWWVWHWKKTPLCTRCWRVCRHVLLPTERFPSMRGRRGWCAQSGDPNCLDADVTDDTTDDGDGVEAEDGDSETSDHPLVISGAGMVIGGNTGATWWDPTTSARVALACSPCIPRCRSRQWYPGFQPSPGWSRIRYVHPWDRKGGLRTHIRIPRPARVLRGGHRHSRIPFLPHVPRPFGVHSGGGGMTMIGRPNRPHGAKRRSFGRRRADEDFLEEDP